MEEILACRVCLATDVKLFDVFTNKLVAAYEMITGVQISRTDGLPHKTCSYCGVMLLKHTAFTERCLNSQELLGYLVKRGKITTEVVRHIDRSNYPPQPLLTIESAYSTASKDEIKEEDDVDYCDDVDLGIDNDKDVDMGVDNDIKSEASDEEPLSKKIERKNGGSEAPLIKEEFDGVPEIDLMFLSKEEQVEELRKRMGSLNYINSLYKCEFCYKGFMTDVTYKNHMVRHDPKAGEYRCDVCSTYCASLRALRGHAATSHERTYVCRLCRYLTKSGSRAREHARWHLGHTYACALCGARFSKSTSYLTHLRLRHPSRHSCALCGHSFVGRAGLNLHLKKTHRQHDEQSLSARCEQCGAKFSGDAALGKHRELGCGTAHRPCVQCGESFLSDDKLSEHYKAAHAALPARCEECDKTFSSSRSFAIHHRRVHAAGPPRPPRPRPAPALVCELCGKACHSPARLLQHQRTHSGERPHQCPRCPKTFSNTQLLQVHTRTHTGERPYKCEVCGKGFVHKAGLNRHARVHTGEKPYGCPHCGKAFSQSNSLKLHVGVNALGLIQYVNFDLYEAQGYKYNELLSLFTIDAYYNCYYKERWNFKGYEVLTDIAKTTWFRAPGTLEAVAMAEFIMEHISYALSLDPVDVRLLNLDVLRHGAIKEMYETLKSKSDYDERRSNVEEFNKNNRWKKRGLRTAFLSWTSLTGILVDVNVAVYHDDGTVLITHGGIDMGQGVNTIAAQVCAHLLKIDISKVQVKGNSTITTINNDLSGGSFTTPSVIIGVEKCCEELLLRLLPVHKTMPGAAWEKVTKAARVLGIDLHAHTYVRRTDSPLYFIYGVAFAEVEVDILTGESEVVRVDILQDTGRSVNPDIDIGQVEGAFVMGQGYWTSEQIVFDHDTGEVLTDRAWNYYVPQARDIPQDFRVYLRKKSMGKEIFLGSKATGEPPICLSVVVALALREAVTAARFNSGIPTTEWFPVDGPLTTERICMLSETKEEDFKFN